VAYFISLMSPKTYCSRPWRHLQRIRVVFIAYMFWLIASPATKAMVIGVGDLDRWRTCSFTKDWRWLIVGRPGPLKIAMARPRYAYLYWRSVEA